MAFKMSTTVRNARLDAVESTIGTSAIMRIWAGTIRTDCSTADDATGTNILAEITLPSDWMAAASGGSKAKSGTWSDASANNTGTASYFRVYESTGTTCHMQGTITATGGGGDMTVDNTSIASSQPVTITGFTLTDGNA